MEWTVPVDLVGRILIAALLGGIIGVERELDGHPAGVRTIMTVAVGAALFGIISTVGFEGYDAVRASTNLQADVSRVASQVVVGIGFLGAGLIFRRGGSVRNLTTAATLWVSAAIGLAAGLGEVGSAAVTTGVLAVVLTLVRHPKRWLVRRFGHRRRAVEVTPSPGVPPDRVRAELDASAEVQVDSWQVEKHEGTLVVRAVLRLSLADEAADPLAGLVESGLVADLRSPPH